MIPLPEWRFPNFYASVAQVTVKGRLRDRQLHTYFRYRHFSCQIETFGNFGDACCLFRQTFWSPSFTASCASCLQTFTSAFTNEFALSLCQNGENLKDKMPIIRTWPKIRIRQKMCQISGSNPPCVAILLTYTLATVKNRAIASFLLQSD